MNLFSLLPAAKKARRRGFTMIEVVIAIAIGAIVVLLAIRFGGSADTKSRAQNLSQSTAAVNSNAVSLFKPDFSALTCTALAQGSGFKGTSYNVDAAYNVTWGDSAGTTVNCAPATLLVANDAFSLTFNGMSDEECTAFVSNVDPQAHVIDINGTVVKARLGTLQPATQTAQCIASPGNEVVTITLARTQPNA